ncbi:glycosyltransferase [Lentilactobacillus sp. SPB1-3]|uniref:Glycosyltransferase family 2 protein n=1 Tax=Lentilactobacillus terminaliae TaxID=3003483 RepID=A0ACD5DE27_9LACO|nr:glycosyltransferase family 2 protein [Lentilactobacillus sp. SPB1-3]MCZ0977771.1 glycosyltransferase family 2 protein [Lentilactobacillus sp. SPB1-3]
MGHMGLIQWGVLILSLYPILGAFFWFWGAIMYRILNRDDQSVKSIDEDYEPLITIMIPAHNEEIMIEHTLNYLLNDLNYLLNDLNYSNYEILVMDDGSTDDTPKTLAEIQTRYDNLRVIRIDDNKGKAHAFNVGMFFAKGEYILSNDADTLPEPDALKKYMGYFTHDSDINTAAVTANMDVQNRTTILGKSQTVEFSSIVGIIKRSQSAINNSMYAYSGANTMYKKAALFEVGGFRQDRATEDISIAWDQHLKGTVPKFAPEIMFNMTVPEKIGELFRQRSRWAKGGTEVWLTNIMAFIRHPIKNKYQFTMFLDSTLSILWSFFFVISTLVFIAIIGKLLIIGSYQHILMYLMFSCVMIVSESIAGGLQLLTALILDFNGAKMKYWIFAPIYTLIYWIINPLTLVWTFPGAVKTILGRGSGTWVSPERK